MKQKMTEKFSFKETKDEWYLKSTKPIENKNIELSFQSRMKSLYDNDSILTMAGTQGIPLDNIKETTIDISFVKTFINTIREIEKNLRESCEEPPPVSLEKIPEDDTYINYIITIKLKWENKEETFTITK